MHVTVAVNVGTRLCKGENLFQLAPVALAVALHLLVLSLAWRKLPHSWVEGNDGRQELVVPVQIDLSVAPPSVPATREAPVQRGPNRQSDSSRPSPVRPDLKLLTPLPVPANGSQPGGSQPLTAAMGQTPVRYLPRELLTRSARALDEPEVHLPPGWLEAFGTAMLTLYVGAGGKVDRVEIGRNTLAPALHEPIQNAFSRLSFAPAEVEGKAVASIMEIEADIGVFLAQTGRR